MENAAEKAVREAVEYVEKVIKDKPQLLDFYSNLNDEVKDIGLSRDKLMKVLHKYTKLRLLMDLTSPPIRKICINTGYALAVTVGKNSFAIGYDLRPAINDPHMPKAQLDDIHVLDVHNVHEKMFLCFHGPIRDWRVFLTEALKINQEHINMHGINMPIEVMSDKLGKFYFEHNRLKLNCEMILAGFDDKNETRVYTIDPAGYTQLISQFATIGRRKSDLHNICSIDFRRPMDHDETIDKLSKSLTVALAEPGGRMHFRGFLYFVTPEKTKGGTVIGKEE